MQEVDLHQDIVLKPNDQLCMYSTMGWMDYNSHYFASILKIDSSHFGAWYKCYYSFYFIQVLNQNKGEF